MHVTYTSCIMHVTSKKYFFRFLYSNTAGSLIHHVSLRGKQENWNRCRSVEILENAPKQCKIQNIADIHRLLNRKHNSMQLFFQSIRKLCKIVLQTSNKSKCFRIAIKKYQKLHGRQLAILRTQRKISCCFAYLLSYFDKDGLVQTSVAPYGFAGQSF